VHDSVFEIKRPIGRGREALFTSAEGAKAENIEHHRWAVVGSRTLGLRENAYFSHVLGADSLNNSKVSLMLAKKIIRFGYRVE